MKKKRRLIITGGHLTPALAVIEELNQRGGWQIFFLGRQYASEREKTPSVESQIIPDRGIRFAPIVTGRFPRHLNRYAFFSTLKIPLGFVQALFHLVRFRPHLILSFGGYVSVPVVLAGWFLGIPSLTHEQTTVRGMATKINSLFAKKIAVSWPQTLADFPAQKTVLTGNPIRKENFQVDKKIWRILKFPPGRPLIFITGGNQGAHVINLAVEAALPRLLKLANVFHQCGHLQAEGDFERLEKARQKLPPQLRKSYHLKKYLNGEEMGTLFHQADLVVCRAGANTLSEIAALGKPALFIPLPWLYQDEQLRNAQMLAKLGAAAILRQRDLSGKTLSQRVAAMMENLRQYQKAAPRMKRLVKLNAAEKIVDELEKMV